MKGAAYATAPTGFGHDPLSKLPGRIMTDVLGMAALQNRDPSAGLVLAKTNDLRLDQRTTSLAR